MKLVKLIKKSYCNIKIKKTEKKRVNDYIRRFRLYSFQGEKCIDERQYEAAITRMYHTIEKGLAFENYRAGFGKENIAHLINMMTNYINAGYSSDALFYRNALSVLKAYIMKNKSYGLINELLEKQIESFPGMPNYGGGTVEFIPLNAKEIKTTSYNEFILSRHSMRQFSQDTVNRDTIINSLELAQHTPSACNRQGWRTVIIENKSIMRDVLKYQNGNKGFGDQIDKLIVVLGDLRCFNRDREMYQVFIDGGMYAQSIINALHYNHLATVPLSGSLSNEQELMVRKILHLRQFDEIIMFIGVGNYPNRCISTMSSRRKVDYEMQ